MLQTNAKLSSKNKLSLALIGFTLLLFITQSSLSLTQNNHRLFKKVLLVVAMDKEAEPIIKALNLHKTSISFNNLPMQSYSGKYEKISIFMIVNGKDPLYKVQNVGTQPATLATYLGINYFRPDLVISIGTAGGVKNNGAQIKQIYASKKVCFYDRSIPAGKDYYNYGLGRYLSANFDVITKKIDLKSGIVCSGDSFVDSQTDTRVIKEENCNVIDMEAAGVAWVCMLMKVPMVAIKGITDYIEDKNGYQEYQINFNDVTKALTQKLKDLLFTLSRNSLN